MPSVIKNSRNGWVRCGMGCLFRHEGGQTLEAAPGSLVNCGGCDQEVG